MLNYNIENYKKKLEDFRVEDEKEQYTFRANKKYIFSSSIFFICITYIAVSILFKKFSNVEKVSTVKVIFSILLLIYVTVTSFIIFSYKIVIQNKKIIFKNVTVDMKNIEKAVLKIDRVKGSKFDKFLEITTKDKKKIKCRLNINKILLFLKLIQNEIGEKLEFLN